MGKIIKHGAEEIYSLVYDKFKPVREELESRDPMLVKNDGKMQAFRLVDVEMEEGKSFYKGKVVNCTNWIFFGERLSLDEYEVLLSTGKISGPSMHALKLYGNSSVCHTQVDEFLPMNPTDITYDEFLTQMKENKDPVKIIRK